MPVFVGQCASKVLLSAMPVEAGVGDPCGSKDTGFSVLETMGTVICVRGCFDCLELDVGDKSVYG